MMISSEKYGRDFIADRDVLRVHLTHEKNAQPLTCVHLTVHYPRKACLTDFWGEKPSQVLVLRSDSKRLDARSLCDGPGGRRWRGIVDGWSRPVVSRGEGDEVIITFRREDARGREVLSFDLVIDDIGRVKRWWASEEPDVREKRSEPAPEEPAWKLLQAEDIQQENLPFGPRNIESARQLLKKHLRRRISL